MGLGTDQTLLRLAGRECSTHQQDRRFPWPSRGKGQSLNDAAGLRYSISETRLPRGGTESEMEEIGVPTDGVGKEEALVLVSAANFG